MSRPPLTAGEIQALLDASPFIAFMQVKVQIGRASCRERVST